MFRISIKEVNDTKAQLEQLEKEMRQLASRLDEMIHNIHVQEAEGYRKRLGVAADELITERRNIWELIITLSYVSSIYTKSEAELLAALDEIGNHEQRDAAWLDLSFSQESMKLIRMIKL